ncbi:MAG: hypothetical protein CMN44_03370 [SAR116 cluster bacterium]|nr:hypothetical protein [SAR116 cluster bacterium]RPH10911.1 MAG: AI-2E family transporter [Alphaproteobacteria bacterium TMED54]
MIIIKENRKNIFFIICLTILTLGVFSFYEITYPFVLAFILAYLLSPINDKINTFIPITISSFISILFFLIITFLTMSLAVPIILAQFEKVVIFAPKYINELNEIILPYYQLVFDNKDINPKNLLEVGTIFLKKIGDAGFNFFKGGVLILNSIFDVFLILILTFYMLLEMKNIKSFVFNLTKDSKLNFFSNILEEIHLTLSNYIRGQIIICIILSIYYSTTLYLISLEFGFILGIFIGLISFVPYVGAFIGCTLALLLGSMQFGYSFELFAVAITFLIGQFLESYVLTPKFIGEAVKLNPIWIIFALSVGGSLFGILGVLMAIPMAAIIGVLARFIFYIIFEKS